MYISEETAKTSNKAFLDRLEMYIGARAVNTLLSTLCNSLYDLQIQLTREPGSRLQGGVSEGEHPRSC